MLMLLSMHVTSVLFLVLFNNFHSDYGLLLELHALTLVARFYALLTFNTTRVMNNVHDALLFPVNHRRWVT